MSVDVQSSALQNPRSMPMSVAQREDQIREAEAFWSRELQGGRLSQSTVERTMLTTALAAISPPVGEQCAP